MAFRFFRCFLFEQGTGNPTVAQLIALRKYSGAVTVTSSGPSDIHIPFQTYFFSIGKVFLKVVPFLHTSLWHIPYAAKRAHFPFGGISLFKSDAFQRK